MELNGHRGAHRDQRLGRVHIGQRRGIDRHLGDGFRIAADQVARADIAFELPRSSKKRRDHSTGLPRLPSMVGITTSAPRSGSNAAISAVDQRGTHLRHVAEADDRAVGRRPAPPRCRS